MGEGRLIKIFCISIEIQFLNLRFFLLSVGEGRWIKYHWKLNMKSHQWCIQNFKATFFNRPTFCSVIFLSDSVSCSMMATTAIALCCFPLRYRSSISCQFTPCGEGGLFKSIGIYHKEKHCFKPIGIYPKRSIQTNKFSTRSLTLDFLSRL